MDLDFKRSQTINRVALKMEFSYWLLATAFTLFTFIIALNPTIVKEDSFLSLQLSLSIPIYFSSIFARAKITANPNKLFLWEKFGFYTFILAYALTVNVIGILLVDLVSLSIGLWFWVANIILALFYTFLEVYTGDTKLIDKLPKDFYFIGILVVFGILHVVGVY